MRYQQFLFPNSRSGSPSSDVVDSRGGNPLFVDPETGEPHIYCHNVSEEEVEEVLRRPGEDRPGDGDARIAIGQTEAGRHAAYILISQTEYEAVREVVEDERRQMAIRAVGFRNAGRRADEAPGVGQSGSLP